MALDLGTGLLALGTVVATVVVGVLSYLRTTGTDAGLRVEVRWAPPPENSCRTTVRVARGYRRAF
jgi:hypothetical protein